MVDHSAATRNPHASRRAARDQRHDLQPAASGRHEDMPASRTYNAAHIGGCRSGGGEHRSRDGGAGAKRKDISRSEEHTSELQSLMRISYAVFCLKKKKSS